MGIRFANLDDVPALVEGGKRMHALTRFKHLQYSEERVARSFSDLMTKGQHKYAFLVAQNSTGQIVGALIGVLEQHIFSDQLIASIMHFDVLPEARMGGYGVRLLKAFEQWASNRMAIEITFGVNSGDEGDRLANFANRMGYRPVGGNYVKERK